MHISVVAWVWGGGGGHRAGVTNTSPQTIHLNYTVLVWSYATCVLKGAVLGGGGGHKEYILVPNRFLSCSWLNQNGPYLWVCSCSQHTLFSSQGYTIPLDKRLASDGRGLQDHTINDNFAKLAQALYTADREVSGHFLCSVAFFPSSASCSPCCLLLPHVHCIP